MSDAFICCDQIWLVSPKIAFFGFNKKYRATTKEGFNIAIVFLGQELVIFLNKPSFAASPL